MSLLIKHLYQFGQFTVDTDQKVLLRSGKPLPVTPKVFDTLLILVQSPQRIVEKEDLMTKLWPDTFVEDANLTFNIQQLRKCLGDNARKPLYIETVPRRGYRFIAKVEEVLSDNIGGQITGHLEDFGDKALDPGNLRMRGSTSPLVVENANSTHESLSSMGTTTVPDRSATRRRGAPAVAVLLAILLGGGFIWWRFSNAFSRQSDKGAEASAIPSVPSALKLEKLTGTGQSQYVAISPDGKYLAYTRSVNHNLAIWLQQLTTNTNVEIVPATGIVYGLAFANSGDYLYFVKGNPTSLYRVSVLGGAATAILHDLEGKFSISTDDSQITFIRSTVGSEGLQEYSLVTAKSDGSNERVLLTRRYPDKLDVPLWSPSSASIICAYGSADAGGKDVKILEVTVSDGATKEWPTLRFRKITKMAWLPQRSGLLMAAATTDFVQLWHLSYPKLELHQLTDDLSSYADLSLTDRGDKAVASLTSLLSDIWVGSNPGANSRKITQAIDNFCWTPDGRLVYSSLASGNGDLWIMRPDGTEQRQLTASPGRDGTPAVTPDNRYVVFMSNRTGSFQVWRMNIDGSNQIELTSGAGKNYPSISADGKWVFYNSTNDWRLWRVSIEGGESSPLTDYVASYPSVSPDGKMIACVGRNGAKHALLVLPQEGGQPIKKIDLDSGDISAPRIVWTADGENLIYATQVHGETAIVRRSLDGAVPEKIQVFSENDLFDFGYSYDGHFLADTRGEWQHDVVLIGFNK
jgi:Tol biopolymer transport system component/DNA-binding winged helix-turn-helix (wHTH) protein